MSPKSAPESRVVRLKPRRAPKASEKKWGAAVMKLGFNIMPSLLFRAQRRLGLNPTQLAILVQLADYWWDEHRKPFPSKDTLSDRLGIGPRQIQRYIAEMEQAGLVKRVTRTAAHRGRLSNAYDLSGLVKRLRELEPEFRKADEEAAEMRRQVSQRGGLKNRKNQAPDS